MRPKVDRPDVSVPPPAETAAPAPAPTLGGAAQFGALAVALVYAIGMVIVNLHLRQYELVSLELARPEYVMAGALWAFLTAISVGGAYWSVEWWERRKDGPRWLRFPAWMFALVGWIAPAGTIMPTIGYRPGGGAPWWADFLGVVIAGLNGVIVYVALRRLRSRLARRSSGSPRFGVVSMDDVIVPFPWVFIAVVLYASIVFPDLPREIGGGRRPSVEVLLSEVPTVDWAAAGLTFSADRKAIGPAMLLLDTTSAVVLHRPEAWNERRFFGGRAASTLALERKLVSAVVYLPRGGSTSAKK